MTNSQVELSYLSQKKENVSLLLLSLPLYTLRHLQQANQTSSRHGSDSSRPKRRRKKAGITTVPFSPTRLVAETMTISNECSPI
jgi:hypothetical protein